MFICLYVYIFICLRADISILRVVDDSDVMGYDRRRSELAV